MKSHFHFSSRAGNLRVIITLIVFVTAYALFSRALSSMKQLNSELSGIIDSSDSVSLDGLQRLSDGKIDDHLEKYLTGFPIPAKEMDSWRTSFFSPYLIRESSQDYESPPTPIGTDSFRTMCAKIPDLKSFPDQLLAHLASPGILFGGSPPASSTVEFSAIKPSFASCLDEAILWYIAGRLLAEQGRGPEAFRVFTGIIGLAAAFENDRSTHPDKDRRLKSCTIREVAAVGLIETSAELFSDKAELIGALAEIERLDKSFIPIDQILAYDKKIPIEFGRQIASDVAAGVALTKYGQEMTSVSRALADQTTLSAELDQIYDPLIFAFSKPYFIAQRAYNPWQRRQNEMFSDTSIFYVDKNMRHTILEEFTQVLPFYTLIDIKTRQLMAGAEAAIAINVYKAENGSWPASLSEVETWLGQPMPMDIIRNIPLKFKPDNPPYVACNGRDGKPNTADDLVFMPFGKKAEE
ncbi:MAG: hypothetical protein KKB51_01760 [Candidatus Riflebacteria bacterium]|nr:hypothetical protein [Candidatus Riflebacteria bacterium]